MESHLLFKMSHSVADFQSSTIVILTIFMIYAILFIFEND